MIRLGFSRQPKPARPRRKRALLLPGEVESACRPLEARMLPSVDVLTYHNDNLRTGANLAETTLTPANVNAATFGKLAQVAVDGQVLAQPLVKTNVVTTGGATRDLVFVATEHDSVYAFDATTLAPVWHDSLINPAAGVTTASSTDLNAFAIYPEIGITSTPVIDPSTSTLFAVTMIKVATPGGPVFAEQLHALDLATGAEKLGGPVTLQATVPGRGAAGYRGRVSFDAKQELQRSALLLSGGTVYLAFASFDDHDPYHGWVLGYNAQTLRQTVAWANTPNGQRGGIWMSGGGPAADASGAIYLVSGNGTFAPRASGGDWGDSVVKLAPGTLTVVDSFTPSNQAYLSSHDLDLGSGGVLLLPDQPGPTPHLLVTAGKDGRLLLINRDNMGRYASRDRIVQQVPGAVAALFGTPAYFNNTIYMAGTHELSKTDPGGRDYLRAFHLFNGRIAPQATVAPYPFGYPGATPSVSASGASNGIVWAVDNVLGPKGPAVLRAFDATDITRELYDSTQAGARDQAGRIAKFTVPTVANGKVYVAGGGTLTLYGLLGPKSY